MAFVVRADSVRGGGTLLVDKPTRLDAIETALALIEQGRTGVTIMGDDGRVFPQEHFAELLAQKV